MGVPLLCRDPGEGEMIQALVILVVVVVWVLFEGKMTL